MSPSLTAINAECIPDERMQFNIISVYFRFTWNLFLYILASPETSAVRKCCEHKQTIHLWQFLKELLMCPSKYGSYIKWLNHQEGIFKIEDSAKVAKLWGMRKNRPAMNYDKLSRSVRQYYKKGIIKKTTHSKRLVYQFCPNYLWIVQ